MRGVGGRPSNDEVLAHGDSQALSLGIPINGPSVKIEVLLQARIEPRDAPSPSSEQDVPEEIRKPKRGIQRQGSLLGMFVIEESHTRHAEKPGSE